MISYLIQASVYLIVIYLVYRFFLSKETFFQVNRWILLGGMALSLVLPLLPVQESFSISVKFPEMVSTWWQEVAIEDNQITNVETEWVGISGEKNIEHDILHTSLGQEPVTSPIQYFAEHDTKHSAQGNSGFQPIGVALSKAGKHLMNNSVVIYLSGLSILALMLIIQLCRLLYLARSGQAREEEGFRIIENSPSKKSFSFLHLIFINKEECHPGIYSHVLAHEKIHASSGHTIDILAAELLLLILWFNPFAWMYRKSVENNLEFITDQKMLRMGINPKKYQLGLLSAALPGHSIPLVNNYNHSFLKKRIIMMKSNPSPKQNIWKYALLIPILLLTMSCLNLTAQEEVKEEVKPTKIEAPKPPLPPPSARPDLPPPPPPPPSPSPAARPELPPPPPPPPLPGQPAIPSVPAAPNAAPVVPPPPNPKMRAVDMQPPLPPSPLSLPTPPVPPAPPSPPKDLSLNGDWKGELGRGEVCLRLSESEEDRSFSWRECFNTSSFNKIPGKTSEEFQIQRESGTLYLAGAFDGNEGNGTYRFEASQDFSAFIKSNTGSDLSDEEAFFAFLGGIDKNYVKYLLDHQLQFDGEDLANLALHDFTRPVIQSYVDGLDGIGYKKYDLSQLVQLKIHDVDVTYITDMISAGFDKLQLQDFIKLSIHDVDSEYVASISSHGLSDLSVEEITQLSIHDVQADYINSLNTSGLEDLSTQEILAFSMHGIEADFVKDMAKLGFAKNKDELISAGIHGLDVDYVKSMIEMGIVNLDLGDLIQLHMHGVGSEDIKRLKSNGDSQLNAEDYLSLFHKHH